MPSLPVKTRRLASVLETLCYFALIALVVIALYLSADPVGLVQAQADNLNIEPDDMWLVGALAKTLLVSTLWVGVGAALYTLWHMARLFRHYRSDAPLSDSSAHAIRHIGYGLLAQAANDFLGYSISGLILSIDAPVGQRMLSVQLGTTEFAFALSGALFVIVGVVMTQALDAVRENEGFV